MNLKEENEKLRELLRRVYNYVPIPDQIRIDSVLSQQPEQQPVLSSYLDLVEKMTVSVDVSTGEHDAFNRLFCKVAEVQQEGDGSWTILAVDPEPNFAPVAQTPQRSK